MKIIDSKLRYTKKIVKTLYYITIFTEECGNIEFTIENVNGEFGSLYTPFLTFFSIFTADEQDEIYERIKEHLIKKYDLNKTKLLKDIHNEKDY